MSTNDLHDNFESLHFESISVNNVNTESRDEVFATLGVRLTNMRNAQAADLKAKVDSGAQANILPLRLFKQMFPEKIGPDGNPLP